MKTWPEIDLLCFSRLTASCSVPVSSLYEVMPYGKLTMDNFASKNYFFVFRNENPFALSDAHYSVAIKHLSKQKLHSHN
jgi:hypothetical protein